ncbi:MAG: alpha/beta hydrolase [Proteobacteria bacterium]|nr:alpha/beta hydrolase [Pseudomonadota bacterium]
MKRRALLAGLLLMPTAAHARPKKPVKARQTVQKAAAAPPRPAGPQPLVDGKSQLVPFNASAFPYRGFLPDSRKPFLDVRTGNRRGHTSLRGDVYWEDPTYSDRRSLLYLPPGFDPQRPVLLVVFFHGQGATLERDVMLRQAVPRQVAESGQNIALIAPQLALDAGDSSAGNFWRPGHFAAYVDEAAERIMRLYGDRAIGRRLNLAGVVIVAYSGGYLSTAYALERGGANHRVKGVILLDALYGDEDKFAAWIARERRGAFLFSAHTESTKDEHATLQGLLDKKRVPYSRGLPTALTPGTVAFLPCGGIDLHGDFVTRAWRADPLRTALAMIPGYAAPPRDKKGA